MTWISGSLQLQKRNLLRRYVNPLNPDIKIEILIYCPYTLSIEVVGRIC